jgi:excisionase family DNA binding protein
LAAAGVAGGSERNQKVDTNRLGLLTVKEAAARLGIAEKTLRAWADKGRIPSARTLSNYRVFDPEVIDRVRAEMEDSAMGKLAA